MVRVWRIVLGGMRGASLLLALLMGAAWGRSYVRRDYFIVFDADYRGFHTIDASRGRIDFGVLCGNLKGVVYLPGSRMGHESSYARRMNTRSESFLGIGWDGAVSPYPGAPYMREVRIPHAYLLILFAAWPVGRFILSCRPRPARGQGHCLVCGYDLRASPDRCPECGTVRGGAEARS